MSNKDSTPSGSSLDIAGRVTSIVTDLTNQVSTFANDVGNALTGGFTDSRSAPVPGTAEEQTTQAEARTPRPSNAFASADLLFNQNTALLLNENRNNRHKRIISENKFAVRIRSILNKDVVAFHVPPEINESRTTAYKSLDPVHMPGAIQVYQNSSPRTWNLGQIKLISRNGEEAEENLATVNQLRSWMMPFFGDSNTAGLDGYGPNLLGSPPEVLEFTAYSDIGDSNSGSGKGNMTNIRKIPVVLTSLIIPYPTDVDYIQTAQTKQPFPAVTSIDLILVETHSPKQLSEFNLIDFRHGQLEGF